MIYQIETKCKLPMYDGKIHMVNRRFSDFEYLLKQLKEKKENKTFCFPTLPEKRIYNNLDEAFIQ